MRSRNANPASRPMVTGTIEALLEPISMAGIMSDQTDAATMTPDAKPRRAFWSPSGMSFFMKNTKADPRAVPRKGIIKAVKTAFMLFAIMLLEQTGDFPTVRRTKIIKFLIFDFDVIKG